jgi:hypothetical protein
MVVFLMIGILAALGFLCVSPMIGQLASRNSERGSATSSESRPIRKQTLSAR